MLKVAKFVATVIKSFFKPQNIYIKAALKCQNTYIKGCNKLENIYIKTQIISCYLGEKLKISPMTKIAKFVAKFLAFWEEKNRQIAPKIAKTAINRHIWSHCVRLTAVT